MPTLRERIKAEGAHTAFRAEQILDGITDPTPLEDVRDALLGKPYLPARTVSRYLRTDYGIALSAAAITSFRERQSA